MKETLVKIALKDIKPNPARDLVFNPYNELKITALMESMGETGFWANVIVRPSPDGKGYEQAYGHHRTEAARRMGLKEAEFVVQELDTQTMDKMMLLENQEDFRYYPLSMLESVRSVVNRIGKGEIGPFHSFENITGVTNDRGYWKAQVYLNGIKKHVGNFSSKEEAIQAYKDAPKDFKDFREAPNFKPIRSASHNEVTADRMYTAEDVGKFLGCKAMNQVRTALDALYLLDVKTITLLQIKKLGWNELHRFVADAKAERERTVLRKVKTAEEIKRLNEEALRIQAEQKSKEKKIADERAALVKKEAEAKREEDAKKAKTIKERIIEKDEQAEKIAETFEVRKAAVEAKVEEVKQKQVAAKQEDVYLPIRRESDRIVHLLERREEEEEIKALARRALNANDRERLRQAAIAKGTWLIDWVAQQFLPPLSAKNNMAEYRRREEAKRRADKKEEE